jgi:hypothetical protein
MHGKSSNIQTVIVTVSYRKINPHGYKTVVFFINSSKCPKYNTCKGNDCPLTLNCAVDATMVICSIHKITFIHVYILV